MTRISDLDEWRRVCLSAFDNLRTDTEVTMAQVDQVLTHGAQEYAAIDTATDGGQLQLRALIDRLVTVDLEAGEVDAILFQSAEDAARLIVAVS